MGYAILLILAAALLANNAWALGGAGWLLLWPAAGFALSGLAYAGRAPRIYGKRDDGTLPAWSLAIYLPYFAALWMLWHVCRWLAPLPCCQEVLPGVWIGRRPLARELPPDVSLVVDLTAGFFEARGVRRGREYLSVPILDSQAPSSGQLTELVDRLNRHPGTVYLHCAEGCGRAGLLAAALVISRGLAVTADEALAAVRQRRRAVRLSRLQRQRLEQWAVERQCLPRCRYPARAVG